MRIPFWKKWISHFQPLTLETASSEYNPELAVVLDRGRLQLLSKNAIYSWDDLYHNFTIAFGTLDLEDRQINEVLVLGLGLGSVPYILEKLYERDYQYTAVELDGQVAALAAKYTFPRLSSPVEMVTADAGIFVQLASDQFDMIVVDIFEDDRTPDTFETTAFLEACSARLRTGGLLLYNRLYNTSQNIRSTEHFFYNGFRSVFPDAWKIDTGGNWVLAAQQQ